MSLDCRTRRLLEGCLLAIHAVRCEVSDSLEARRFLEATNELSDLVRVIDVQFSSTTQSTVLLHVLLDALDLPKRRQTVHCFATSILHSVVRSEHLLGLLPLQSRGQDLMMAEVEHVLLSGHRERSCPHRLGEAMSKQNCLVVAEP
jgi:hypothetical protein